jgi:ADP-ribosyl-[dinitrogen reductase] hydrolase
MLGAIIGDIVGSVYEFNNYCAKDFDPFFHKKAFFTDDTVCTVAVADALAGGIDPAITLRAWGRKYWKNGGWGLRFAEWLGSDDEGPYNSFGNGAGMRVSPAGLLARSVGEARALSDHVTEVTHNHPEGMRGAAATAVAIYLARRGMVATDIRKVIVADFGYDLSMTVDEIRPGYRYNERSQDTVPQALTCAFEATDFEDAIRNAISIGGDSDTIAAIAGGVAESLFGIPEAMARQSWGMIPQDMQEVMTRVYGMAETRANAPQPPLITVVRGDIVEQRDCDGIVNSANERLRAGSGVCGVIHRAAGPELESFSQTLAPLALGQAVATPSFALPQKAVIHVRGPKYLFDADPAQHLAMAVTNALLVADRERLARVAMPAISTGVFAYPVEEAVPILIAAALAVRARLHHVREIRFVVLDPAMHGLFDAALGAEQRDK